MGELNMNPLEQKLQQLEKRLEAVETARNVPFIKELERRLSIGNLVIETGASTTGTTIAVRNSADTGSEVVADDYTGGVATLYQNGVAIGRIGYYT